MTYTPVTERKRGQWEPKEYYKVRAKIMKECYLRGYNAKQIVFYFGTTLDTFYKSCDVRKLKEKLCDYTILKNNESAKPTRHRTMEGKEENTLSRQMQNSEMPSLPSSQVYRRQQQNTQ